jgi:tRNA 2-thiouridine synthesizing protein A
MNAKQPDHKLDTRGSFCPVPIVKTDAAMRALATGEVLEILADDPGVKLDLPAWCKANGERLLSMEQEGRMIRVLVEKTGESS